MKYAGMDRADKRRGQVIFLGDEGKAGKKNVLKKGLFTQLEEEVT